MSNARDERVTEMEDRLEQLDKAVARLGRYVDDLGHRFHIHTHGIVSSTTGPYYHLRLAASEAAQGESVCETTRKPAEGDAE